MNVDNLTVGEVKALLAMFGQHRTQEMPNELVVQHPMLGRRCLIRTYSAGVHIGDIVRVSGMEVQLKNALRLWSWKDGGLSLSVVANNGIKGGRLNKTGEVYLTNVIEIIPTTVEAEKSYAKFIEE